jgi:pyruvate formate lyase activating enzyme
VPGLIFDIKHYCIHDGPGIRTTVFFKGCPMRCWWCHNPESQAVNPEDLQIERKLDGQSFFETEPVGRTVSAGEMIEEVIKDRVFYDQSHGGVTFSGGEPLMQPEFLEVLLDRCRDEKIHTCLDTTGHAPPNIFGRIIPKTDLFLYDLKLMSDTLHEEYTGVSNQWTLSNLKTLAIMGKDVIIRFPVIPGITDTESNVDAIISFLSSIGYIRRIDLLPYHSIARNKYERFNREYKLANLDPPSKDRMISLLERFQDEGFVVRIGGG